MLLSRLKSKATLWAEHHRRWCQCISPGTKQLSGSSNSHHNELSSSTISLKNYTADPEGPPSSTMCLSSQQCSTKEHNNAQQSTTTKHNKVQQCKVVSTLTPRVQSQQEALMGWHWHTMGSDKRQPRSLFHLQQKWAFSSFSSQTPIFKLKSTIGLRKYVVSS